jgi:hypothetical protein
MAEFVYQDVEAWNSAVKLAAAVGRLKIGSNLKASADAQQHAFEQAGLACALIAEGAGREGGAQVGLYRDARGALAQSRAWLHVLAALMNEPDTIFGNELDLAESASRQLGGMLRTLDRPPAAAPGGFGRPPARPERGPGGPGGGRPGGPPRGDRR